MKIYQSILLAAGLSLTSCASLTNQSPSLTVHVVEASGGAWGAAKMARAAMDSLDGVDHKMMSGRRATLVLNKGAQLTEADVKAALKGKGLKFESLEKHKIRRPAAAYVAKTPKFTWANTAKKVRAAFLNDFPGVQDVFCGTETVVHIKKGGKAPSPERMAKVFADFKVVCDGIARDDSAVL